VYCSSKVGGLLSTADETITILSLVPRNVHDPGACGQQLVQGFRTVFDRFNAIITSESSDFDKISQLESLRNAIRQIKTDLLTVHLPSVPFHGSPRSKRDSLKGSLEKQLSETIATISDLRRQTSLFESLDEQLAQTRLLLTMILVKKPLTSPTSSRSENVDANSNQQQSKAKLYTDRRRRKLSKASDDCTPLLRLCDIAPSPLPRSPLSPMLSLALSRPCKTSADPSILEDIALLSLETILYLLP
jgi:hypothetical protein